MAAHFQLAVVGPDAWLPVVPAGGLVALRISDGAVEVRAVGDLVTTPEQDQSVRELLGRHYRNESWHVDDEPTTRRTLTRAVSASVLEVPTLFCEPRADASASAATVTPGGSGRARMPQARSAACPAHPVGIAPYRLPRPSFPRVRTGTTPGRTLP
jgi:hypothetical protein